MQIVHDGNSQSAHFEHVAEALRRDQAGDRALALENDVGGDRGGVDKSADIGRNDVDLAHDRAKSIRMPSL